MPRWEAIASTVTDHAGLPAKSSWQPGQFGLDIRPEEDFEESFRKPDPGMLVLIHRYFDKPPLSECWMISDALEDEQASEAFGCNFMAGDIWRSRHLPGFHQLSVDVPGLEFLEPTLKGIYRV